MIELLRTKLFIPRSRKNLVSRQHLIALLNAGLDRKLTLIAAPAGFGKTTLLSEWIPQSPRCVTWLSLDESENDPIRFWNYFIASLQGLRQNLGENALGLLQSPQPLPIPSVLTTLLNEVYAFPDIFVTVLDDYHLIETKSIHEALTFLIDHLPYNMHLIISTRADPPLQLARLRARAQLNEIRANDLRFTPGEGDVFLTQVMGLNVSAAEVAALDARIEGWVAGLQIAALSMQGHKDIQSFIQAFSGSHRHILGYLAEEVLNRQPKTTLDFLLHTCILDRMCGPLCDEVTGDTGGQVILEHLEHANLFITPLDDEGRWYRYHHLFAEVLQARLHHGHRDLLPELHRRACIWLEQNDLMDEAINHAIAGGNTEQAAHLVEKIVAIKWRTGEIKTLQKWVSAIPNASWQAYPRLWLVQAWIAMTIGDFVEADSNLQEAEAALRSVDMESAQHLRPEVRAFRASYASLTQDPGAVDLAEQALKELPKGYWMRGMLVVFLGAAYYAAGDLDTALDVLTKARSSSTAEEAGQSHQIHLLAFSGTVHYARGKIKDSLPLFYRALELAEPGGVPIPFVGTLMTYMSITPVLYEQNKLEQAEELLTRCLEISIEFGSAEVEIYTLSLLAQSCLARENLNTAIEYFDRVDVLLLKHTFSSGIMSFVEYRRFILYLYQGHLSAAEKWVDTYGQYSGTLNPHAAHRIALPQLLIALGKYGLAEEKLNDLICEAQESGHGNWLIKALILQALVFAGIHQHGDALSLLQRALMLAEPEGYVRSFIDEGEPLRQLLLEYQSAHKMKVGSDIDGETLRLINYTGKLLAAYPSSISTESKKNGVQIEPLSARELDILRLIAAGHSNREIAGMLVIAVSTVKSHINNLYGKLGTSRRTQAILIAREKGLLSE